MFAASTVHADDNLYNRTIVYDGSARPELLAAAKDAAALLEKITGQTFETMYGLEPAAIVIAKRGAFDRQPKQAADLESKSPEAFGVFPEGDRLWIIGNTDNAAAHGVYWYLEQLGCRFLGPTDTWTITPKRDSIALDVAHIDEPDFLVRGAFATGGYGGNLPLDKTRQHQMRWQRWWKRIRFGGPFKLGGHAGEDFNMRNKPLIAMNEDYRAVVDGERQPWSRGLKPCYASEGMLELYTDDRIAKLREMIGRDPEGPQAFAVSVDPADGGGHCECDDCLEMGSVSDRVFMWANHVARAVRAIWPDKFVSLYAYNQHAMTPTIDLEPNVYVMLVPYGLQYTGLSPNQMIEAWAAKTEHMSVYDYWSITDWSNDLPDFAFRSKLAERVDYWDKHDVESISLQSTASIGSMGLPLYAASRLLWDADQDADAVIDAFYIDAFGSAAPAMGRMLDRWGNGFLLSEHELAQCYRDLAEAERLCDSPDVQARIDDYKAYVHYMRLWYEYQREPRKTSQRLAAADRLVRYLWRIYDTGMVHAYRMSVLLTNRYEHPDTTLREKWAFKDNDIWDGIEPITVDELDALMADGAATYEPADFEAMTFSDDYVPLPAIPGEGDKTYSSLSLAGMVNFEIDIPRGKDGFVFRMLLRKRETENPGDQVTVYDDAGREVHRQIVPPDGQWHDVKVDVPPGRYRMSIYDQKLIFRLEVPGDLDMVMTSHPMATDLAPRLYFFVPRGLKRVAIFQESVVTPIIEDSSGNQLPATGDKLMLIDVPEGEDGKVWSIRHFKTWQTVQFLNVPRATSFSPGGMMVPRELLRDARR